jgi:hypothetical protein
LVDKHQGLLILNTLAQGRDQGASLVGGLDIAGKKDKSPRANPLEKPPLGLRQDRARAAEYTGPRSHPSRP